MICEEDLIIISSFGGSPSANYSAYLSLSGKSGKNLIKTGDGGVYNKKRELFYDKNYRKNILSGLKSRGVECCTLLSADYPEELKRLENPPVTLFLQGDRGLLKGGKFGIVGSRKTLSNAVALCKEFSGELKERFTLVTGSADGADKAVMAGAGYRVISVIAGGHDRAYGGAGDELKRVKNNGLVISESLYSVVPQRYHFPVRNRIIAGLSAGVLVVSAAKKSGALITAGYARQYKKRLYAIPYSPGITSGEGCNYLIRGGATLVTCPQDIFDDFNMRPAAKKTEELTKEEAAVYAVLKDGESFLPSIAQKLGAPVYKILPVLSSLEIKGKVARLGGNRFSAI